MMKLANKITPYAALHEANGAILLVTLSCTQQNAKCARWELAQ